MKIENNNIFLELRKKTERGRCFRSAALHSFGAATDKNILTMFYYYHIKTEIVLLLPY